MSYCIKYSLDENLIKPFEFIVSATHAKQLDSGKSVKYNKSYLTALQVQAGYTQ